jgi:hypothetical protein
MRNSLPILPWLLGLALAGNAGADEVELKNGSKLEGTVQEQGDKVVIDVGSGTITIARSEVKAIHRPEEQIQEFDRRVQSLKPDDASGYYQTYLWARQQPGMKTRAEGLLKKALEADPNYEPARRALGFVNFKGAWLTQDEYKATLGLVRYQGEWVTAEAAERLRRIDSELTLAQAKRAAEEERLREQLTLEREKISVRQRTLEMFRTGELPADVATALGYSYPWGMRYWGPAGAAQPLPNAD